MVLFLDLESSKGTGYLETETRTDTPPAPDLSPLRGTEAYEAHAKDIHHTHVLCFTYKDPPSEPVIETLPLPDVQPTCPPHWDAEAWDKRMVLGTVKYHIFCSGINPDERFISKISDTTDHNGNWVYEDMMDMSTEIREHRTMWTVDMTMVTVLKCQTWEAARLLDNAKWEIRS